MGAASVAGWGWIAQWGLSMFDSMPHIIQEFEQANTLTNAWFCDGRIYLGHRRVRASGCACRFAEDFELSSGSTASADLTKTFEFFFNIFFFPLVAALANTSNFLHLLLLVGLIPSTHPPPYQEGAGSDIQWPEMKEDIWEGFTR